MSNLAEILRQEIRRCGVMTWPRFMTLALDHPNHGFYQQRGRVGQSGDFYTSVSVGAMFGELLGFWLAEKLSSIHGKLQIIEAGANEGRMACDILDWLCQNRSELYHRIEYVVLEPSLRRRQWQNETLVQHQSKVRWLSDWTEIPPRSVRGVVLSNELLDAFPVEVWRWNCSTQQWHEFGITLKEESLTWAPLTSTGCIPRELEALTSALGSFLPQSYQRELNPQAISWWREASLRLEEGWLLTFDYGGSEEEFWAPDRPNGTLRGFRKHQTASVLEAESGDVDLTASVNFTSIQATGEAQGLVTEFYDRQQLFLVNILTPWLATGLNLSPIQTRSLSTLTRPEFLGTKFKAILQYRQPRERSLKL